MWKNRVNNLVTQTGRDSLDFCTSFYPDLGKKILEVRDKIYSSHVALVFWSIIANETRSNHRKKLLS
jgi:hypothetical protein